LYYGIIPANAPLLANVTLLLEVAMGLALVVGALLARRGRYRAHACCQSIVVMLNLLVIAMAMVPSLHERVLPKIPEKLNRSFYAVATAHGLLGISAEVGAIYVVLAAGTTWLPERWRLRNFRTTMRTVLALWWVAIFLGLATYMRWYTRW
jgi:uncharacterized membrane protein YozB (DUF420 family)